MPLSFASSKGVELVVDWLGSVWLAAQPLKTADAQSTIVSDGICLNVVRDKGGNIEKLVSVDKGELEQFVK